jgi:LytS/YehU family sensor histidine kinase
LAPLPRGFLQALFFSLAWVFLLLAILHLAGPDGGPPPGMPPEGPHHHPHPSWSPTLGLVLINVAFSVVFGWVFAEKEATEARERSMAGLLRHSRSRALQNQLEPHVLYNALNGLAELVHQDAPAAEEMIARLADLYRMLTHHGEADMAPLLKERALVEAYLAMEDMRLGKRLAVHWDWPPWADAVVLPPLFLQPLVENAIKHGISAAEEGGRLRIACTRDGETLALSVANTGRPLAFNAKEGVGLANLKARLALWTEVHGDFTLIQAGDWTVATLRWRERP